MFTSSHRTTPIGRIAILSALAVVSACGPLKRDDPRDPAKTRGIGRYRSALHGDIELEDCSPEVEQFLEVSAFHGRVASASAAFAECVSTNVASTYRACRGDPGEHESVAQQIDRVLAVARSGNDVRMQCVNGPAGGNAVANIGAYGQQDPEVFWWSDWINAVEPASYLYPQCPRTVTPCNDYRDLGNGELCVCPGWPYSQAAGIAWHEAMHTHGYLHGAGDSANSTCGYAGDTTWNSQVNTMPYIIGSCIARVIQLSAAQCTAACPDENQRAVVTDLNAAGCQCVTDPRYAVLGNGATNTAASAGR